MYELLNIPTHENCTNCGECCGPVPVTDEEIEAIRQYLSDKPEIKIKAEENRQHLTCKFRDNDKKRCMVYPARPLVCRLMGVSAGLVCDNGNSANIDGFKFFIDRTGDEDLQLLNEVRF